MCFSPSHNSFCLEGGKKERERGKGVKDKLGERLSSVVKQRRKKGREIQQKK